MTTKNDTLFVSNKSFNKNKDTQQFTNLNLNQNYQPSLHSTPVQSYSKLNLEKNREEHNNRLREKSSSGLHKKPLKNFKLLDESKKRWTNDSLQNTSNSSTLSLHIAAYENATEESSNNKNSSKAEKSLDFALSKLKDYFEYSRQIEDNSEYEKQPEIMHFKASQKLLSPNQSVPLNEVFVSKNHSQHERANGLFGRFNGMIFASLLFFTSLLGSVFILFPFIPLAFFAPRIFRFVCDRFVGYWLTFPASMLTFMFGVKFHVSGDLIEHSKPALIIMNHRTRLDWMFFWNALYKMNPWLLTSEKISLKAGLKSIPGAGWAMGCGAYIFLNRSYELDQRIIETMLQYYKESLCSYQLLLFPEGTDRGERAARISDEFAKKNGLQKYDNVLHPRTTGFNFILNEMRKHDYIDAIYDVTVAYPDKIISSEMDLIAKGTLPKNVHFEIKKYTVADILTDEQQKIFHRDPVDASSWLLSLWKEKETRLKKFYSQAPEKRKLEPSGKGYLWPAETKEIGYFLSFAFWIAISLVWIYFAVKFPWVKYYIISAIGFYLYAQKYHGGAEFLFLEWFFGRRLFLEKAD